MELVFFSVQHPNLIQWEHLCLYQSIWLLPHLYHRHTTIILLRNGLYTLEMLGVEWGEELYLCLPSNNAKWGYSNQNEVVVRTLDYIWGKLWQLARSLEWSFTSVEILTKNKCKSCYVSGPRFLSLNRS